MSGPFIQPHPEKGDPNTIGGYAAVHGRPAAFEGVDGLSYSVELYSDSTGDRSQPYGAFILFLRWNETADPVVTGHIETAFLEFGSTPDEALAKLGAMKLADVLELLNKLIAELRQNETNRPWWEVMNDEGDS